MRDYEPVVPEEDECSDADINQADLDYIAEHDEELAAEQREYEAEDLLDWTEEEERGWAQQDKIDLYRNEY